MEHTGRRWLKLMLRAACISYYALRCARLYAGTGIGPLSWGSAGLAGAGMLGPGVYSGSMRGGSGGTRTISGILNMGHPLEGHPSAQGAKFQMQQA